MVLSPKSLPALEELQRLRRLQEGLRIPELRGRVRQHQRRPHLRPERQRGVRRQTGGLRPMLQRKTESFNVMKKTKKYGGNR